MLANVCVAVAIPRAAVGQATPVRLEPTRTIEGAGFVDDAGDAARDLSGIACMTEREGRRLCLVVNDEDRSAQSAVLANDALTAGSKIPLIDKKPSALTLGVEPVNTGCPGGPAKFKDLDGEAVAYAEPYFYVVGSHGCGRKAGKFRSSSYILARAKLDQDGRASGDVATTYRLAALLQKAAAVAPYYAKDLTTANGLNIEGLLIDGDRAIMGLRAPSLAGRAFLVSAKLAHLFSTAANPPDAELVVMPVSLGKDLGIRDLAMLPDRRWLVLAGPAQEQQDVPYGLFLIDPVRQPVAATHLATLAPVMDRGKPGKPEAIVVLEASTASLRLLMLFDGFANGAPRMYQVPLRQGP